VAPKKTELRVLAAAMNNLAQFASYAQAMGPYAPSYEETIALFTVVHQWSAMRTARSAWDAYCVDQEGLGWATLRPVMTRLGTLFDIAVNADPTLLVTLQRNKQSKAGWEPRTHGRSGKTSKRAEEKAALETPREQQQPSGAAAGAAGQGSMPTAPRQW
jgi:hypothetical protein